MSLQRAIRPLARGLCCRGRSHGQWPSVFCLCLAPPNPSKPGLAASSPASSRAGPIPGLPVHSSASVRSRDPEEPAREPTHASLCPWPLALVTGQLGPEPLGAAQGFVSGLRVTPFMGLPLQDPLHCQGSGPWVSKVQGCVSAAQRPGWRRWACLMVS